MRTVLFLIFFASAPAWAGNVILSSDPDSFGSLAQLPGALVKQLEQVGVSKGIPTLSGGESMRSLSVFNLRCLWSQNDDVVCGFEAQKNGKRVKVFIPSSLNLLNTLRAIETGVSGLHMTTCDDRGRCALEASSVLCLVNVDFSEGQKGKYSCAIVD